MGTAQAYASRLIRFMNTQHALEAFTMATKTLMLVLTGATHATVGTAQQHALADLDIARADGQDF